jgi:acetyl esterase/lipase
MKKSILLPTALLAATLPFAYSPWLPEAASGQASSSPQSEKGAVAQENVSYGSVNGTDLLVDIYQSPARGTKSSPAVVLIHGGGWTDLDKSTTRAMGQFLARSGYVAFSVNYRLFHGTENRWPAQLDDVQRAVRWVRANAAKYNVDPERIGAFGHSAGAQLAALLGMEETRDNSEPSLASYSSKVQAVVDVSGPSDFTIGHNADGTGFLARFLGADYSTHPEVWREASPAFRVSKGDAPFLILHGTQDQEVPISQAQELFEKLQSAGVPVSFIKIDDVHTFRSPDSRRQLAIESLAFFHRYLDAPR